MYHNTFLKEVENMDESTINDFCHKWLSAWTGNKPELLIKFYAKNAYYQDPANPEGLKGHEMIFSYFKKLLTANPTWIWEAEEIFPTKNGFTLKWKATIPIGTEKIIEYGMDIVEVDKGQIVRNEVYFDRSKFLALLERRKKDSS